MLKQQFYTQSPLDRAAHWRKDREWIAAKLADPSTRIVPVWRNRNLVREITPDSFKAVFLAPGKIDSEFDQPVFLGVDGEETAWFSIDISTLAEEKAEALSPAARFIDLWELGTLLEGGEASILGYAKAMAHWHRRHIYCGKCGAPTEVRDTGHQRMCINKKCGMPSFPRTDPAVIMLVTAEIDGEPACLLGRQERWPEGMFSTLAGFFEPGESLEETVAREVREETGVIVDPTDVRYLGSQPWPFPASLMLGFHAKASKLDLDIDHDEMDDARWFKLSEIEARKETGLYLPRRHSIARALIDRWLEDPVAP